MPDRAAPRTLARVRRLAIVFATLAVFLAPPGAALAQIGPLPPAPPPDAPPPPGPTVPKKDEGFSTKQQLLVVAAAAALIGAIAFVIVRDARRSAPAPQRKADEDAPKLSPRERERVKRQRRDKAKRAKQQRKRNRRR
jgi:hypothetical protein